MRKKTNSASRSAQIGALKMRPFPPPQLAHNSTDRPEHSPLISPVSTHQPSVRTHTWRGTYSERSIVLRPPLGLEKSSNQAHNYGLGVLALHVDGNFVFQASFPCFFVIDMPFLPPVPSLLQFFDLQMTDSC